MRDLSVEPCNTAKKSHETHGDTSVVRESSPNWEERARQKYRIGFVLGSGHYERGRFPNLDRELERLESSKSSKRGRMTVRNE